MTYLCTEEKAHYEPIDELGNWEYIIDEKRSKRTDLLPSVFNYAMEFVKKHPGVKLSDKFDVHGFFIDDGINAPNVPTYCFYVEIVRE